MKTEEDQNPLVDAINYGLALGEAAHKKFVDRHLGESGGLMDGFYKAICLENDFENNIRVEEYWKSINPNVNRLWEFVHLAGLKIRGAEEVYAILKDYPVTDIFIEVNILEQEQFLGLLQLSKAIYGQVIGTYLDSLTFIHHDTSFLAHEMVRFIQTPETKQWFEALCKSVKVKFVEHFYAETEKVVKSFDDLANFKMI